MSAGILIKNHKTIDERIIIAKKLIDDFNISVPIYCDQINDLMLKELSTWPIQFFMIDINKKIIGIGKPNDATIDCEQILNLL